MLEPQIKNPIRPLMAKCLRLLYNKPASVTMVTQKYLGWKLGKTDMALSITEKCAALGIINQFASNTETWGEKKIEFINDFDHYDLWMKSNRKRKLFIYDEIAESSPRRRAMGSINVEWSKKIPQLSKGKGHLIVISQAEHLGDSIFMDYTFLRAVWYKLDLTTAELHIIGREKKYLFRNLPRTQLKFDPYSQATFKMTSSIGFELLPLPLKVAQLYAKGKSLRNIGRELGVGHQEEVKRLLREACEHLVTKSQDNALEDTKPQNSDETANLM